MIRNQTFFLLIHLFIYFLLWYLSRSVGSLLLSEDDEEEEESDLTLDDLIIQMFTSHITALHSQLCLVCTQTLITNWFNVRLCQSLGDVDEYIHL